MAGVESPRAVWSVLIGLQSTSCGRGNNLQLYSRPIRLAQSPIKSYSRSNSLAELINSRHA